MFKSIFNKIVDLEWKTRIYVSSVLILLTTLIFLFYHVLWFEGYIAAGVVILTGLFFREKHVEFDEKKAEELVVTKFFVNNEKLRAMLNFIQTISVKGFDESKVDLILSTANRLKLGEQRMFNYFISTNETKTSVSITILKQETDMVLNFTSNQALNHALKNFMERNEIP